MREVGQAKELVEKMLTFIEQVSHRKLKFSSIVDMNTGATSDPTDRLVAAVDAALRRAKGEGAREMIKIVKAHKADQRVADDLNNTVSFDSFNEVLDAITREADARAAQIEEGE